jgi:ABC-type sugar transport system ATPase subunit
MPDGPLTLGLRPQHLVLQADGPLAMQVDLVEALGAESVVHGTLSGGAKVLAVLPGQPGLKRGDTIALGFDPAQVHAFDAQGLRIG